MCGFIFSSAFLRRTSRDTHARHLFVSYRFFMRYYSCVCRGASSEIILSNDQFETLLPCWYRAIGTPLSFKIVYEHIYTHYYFRLPFFFFLSFFKQPAGRLQIIVPQSPLQCRQPWSSTDYRTTVDGGNLDVCPLARLIYVWWVSWS